MKPLKLHLKNIGPFLDETLDFTNLNEMFLVTGKTGSGKTTLFDAMTYALYGNTSGSRELKNFHLHSDFASSDEESYVDFTFLLNGNKYHINRTTSWEYVNRNGKISTKLPKALFQVWNQKLSSWEDFTGTTTQLDQKIEELIGLTREEFIKIVILPQGSFARFLHENSQERRKTLQKLFPVDIYTDIAQRIADQAKEKLNELDRLEKNLSEAQKDKLIEDSDNRLCELEKQIALKDRELSSLSEEIKKTSAECEKVNSLLERAVKARTLSQKLASLEEKAEEINLKKTKIDLAEKAAIVYPVLQKYYECKKNFSQINSNKSETEDKVKEASVKKAELEKLIPQNKSDTESLEQKKTLLEKAREHIAPLKELEESKKHFLESFNELFTINKELKDSCIYFENKKSESAKKIEERKDLISKTEITAADLLKQKEEKEINEKAGFLAKTLSEGKPCPVCGSLTHPSCAKLSSFTLDLEDRLETENKNLEAQRELLEKEQNENDELLELIEKIDELKVQTEDAVNSAIKTAAVISLQDEIKVLQNKISSQSEQNSKDYTLTVKNARSKVFIQFKEKCISSLNNMRETNSSLNAISSQNKDYKGESAESLELQINSFEKEIALLTARINKFEYNLQTSVKETAVLEERLNGLTKQFDSAKQELENSEKAKTQAIENSNFSSEEEVLQSRITPEDLTSLKQECAQYTEDLTAVKTELKAQNAKSEDEPELKKKYKELNEKINDSEQKSVKLKEERTELTNTQTRIHEALKRKEELLSEQKKLRSENEILFALDRDLNGKNPKKIQFDSWILGTFLEDIVTSANIHFAQISGNRFSFTLLTDGTKGNSYKGLDLTVYDSFTGKERDSASLSGGETFMASLSLALALTDVVQSRSGSIRLDSLFIDEGFGSLDGESLDNAISILEQIREERMVGIISHVESLETAIPCHVNVKKTNSGSKITVLQ